MTFTSLLVLVSRLCTIIIEGKDMAVRIKFDYYHLKIDRKRARLSDQGQVFFGNISLSALCKELMGFQNNPTEFTNNGKQVLSLKDGKKWIKWVNITYDEKKKFYKLLFTYNDIEVDPRILEDRSNNVLTQDIPDQHGQRTLLHIVFKPDSSQRSQCKHSIYTRIKQRVSIKAFHKANRTVLFRSRKLGCS